MGLLFSRPPESLSMPTPPFRTPFTDITAPVGHWEKGPCMPFELRWLDCLDAYGNIQGKEKCKLLYQDFNECGTQWKRLHRVQDMKEERTRQWFNGVIGKGPKIALHEEGPSPDSFQTQQNIDEP